MDKCKVVIYWNDFKDINRFEQVPLRQAEELAGAVGTEEIISFNFISSSSYNQRKACVDMRTVRMVTYGA